MSNIIITVKSLNLNFTNEDINETGILPTNSSGIHLQNATDIPELPFDDVAVGIIAAFLIIFMIFGFIGNLLTILVIVTSSKLKNVFNQFILSLCVSDLISALISWINLYRRTWGFNIFALPNFFCWFYWGADMWTSYVTAQHILSFAILRLISVWKPVQFTRIKTMHTTIWIVIIWVVAFSCGFIPFAIFSGASERDRTDRTSPLSRWPSCTQNNKTLSQYTSYIKYAYPIFFYFPLVAIVVISFIIGIILLLRKSPTEKQTVKNGSPTKRKEKGKSKKEKQAILQLALIVGSFMIGYVPFTVFEFYTLNNKDTTDRGWHIEWLFGTLVYVFLRFSECLNPLFYNLASSKLRKETWAFLRKLNHKKVVFTITNK